MQKYYGLKKMFSNLRAENKAMEQELKVLRKSVETQCEQESDKFNDDIVLQIDPCQSCEVYNICEEYNNVCYVDDANNANDVDDKYEFV
jgi:hypothetical protein